MGLTWQASIQAVVFAVACASCHSPSAPSATARDPDLNRPSSLLSDTRELRSEELQSQKRKSQQPSSQQPSSQQPSSHQDEAQSAALRQSESSLDRRASGAKSERPRATRPQRRRHTLPDAVRVGEVSQLPVDGRAPLLVVHGQAAVRRALVYLHGRCGDPSKIAAWARAVSDWVTTIAPQGDVPCAQGSGRHRWSLDIARLHQAIEAALKAVQVQRGGLLDIDEVAVFGYSQGSLRAEMLLERYPQRYRWGLLGGLPRPAKASRLQRAEAVVVLSGEREPHRHLEKATEELGRQGVRQIFLVFPNAAHGEFGPSSPQIMNAAFEFLFEGG